MLKREEKKLNLRQARVLTRLSQGKKACEIMKELGMCKSTMYYDVKKIKESGVLEDEVDLAISLTRKALDASALNVIGHILAGEYEPARDNLRGHKVWSDKIEVQAKVDPSDQQLKMVKRLETLLKLNLEVPLKAEVKPHEMTPEERNEPQERVIGGVLHVDEELIWPDKKEDDALQERRGPQGQAEDEKETQETGQERGGDTTPPTPEG